MTNAEILNMECAVRGIVEDVHTFARWKQLGYHVRKGERALFSTNLWKPGIRKRDAEATEDEDNKSGRMFLCKAYLFGKSQVEEVTNEKAVQD